VLAAQAGQVRVQAPTADRALLAAPQLEFECKIEAN